MGELIEREIRCCRYLHPTSSDSVDVDASMLTYLLKASANKGYLAER